MGSVAGSVWRAIYAIRRSREQCNRDIHTVESLKWFWSGAAKGAGLGFLIGLVTFAILLLSSYFGGLIFDRMPSRSMLIGNFLGFEMFATLLGAIFGGLRTNLIDGKLRPNQGI